MPPRSHGRPSRRSLLAAEGCLAAAVGVLPLTLGGALGVSTWWLAGCAFLSLALVVDRGRGVRLPFLAALLAGLAGVGLLQLVPWPRPLLGLFSPAAQELRDFALVPLGLSPHGPISLDPPATWREVAKHLSYAAALTSAAALAQSRSARRRLLTAVVLSGVLVAAIGFLHALLGWTSLFGLYAYQSQPPAFLTTFGNPNHLAAFLTLTSTVSLGLALTAQDRRRASWYGGGYLVMGAGVLLSLSRGGIFFFVATQVLLAAVLWRTRQAELRATSPRREAPPPLGKRGMLILAGVVTVFAIGMYVAFDALAAELGSASSIEQINASKIHLWPMMAEGALAFWRLGMGRGAYEAAFARFQTHGPGVTYTHPENALLQLVSELGAPLAVLALALGAYGLWRLFQKHARSLLDSALLCGVLGVLLHDLLDFSLELPATALVAAVCLGVTSREGAEPKPREAVWLRPRALPAVGLTAALALAALFIGRGTLARATAEVVARYQAGDSGDAMRPFVLERIERHPASAPLYAVLARAYAKERATAAEALAFVNRALFLRPLDMESHRTAARSLLALGRRSQAFLEYRLAYETNHQRWTVLDEAVRAARQVEDLQSFVGPRAELVSEVVTRLPATQRPLARALVEWAKESLGDQDVAGLWVLSAQHKSQDADYEGALADLQEAERRAPGDVEAALVRASVLVGMGRVDEAVAALNERALQRPQDAKLSFHLAETLLHVRQPRAAREVLTRLSPFLSSLNDRVRLLRLEGKAFHTEGRHALALEAYQRAARLSPSSAQLHYDIASVQESLKNHPAAIDAIRQGMKFDHPSNAPKMTEWMERLRKQSPAPFVGRD